MPTLPWIDWALLAVLLVSVVIGLVRGFVFEVMALVGWVVAWFGSQYLAREVAPHIPVGAPGSSANLALAYVLCFIGILLVWALLARLLRMLIHATPLSIPDRLLGAGFGLLRGGVLLLALSTVVALTPAAQSKPWQRSDGARWLDAALLGLKPLLPAEVARYLPN
jgi:membrane protein required for colicin V production